MYNPPDFTHSRGKISGLTSGGRISGEFLPLMSIGARVVRYSAAFAGFSFAADTMKSEIRGTISERKREPLKTP